MASTARSSDDALHGALEVVAPGTQLRDGLDRIVRAKMGALVVIGDSPEVLAICTGGFLLDAPFSPQKLSELAKMDGAVILSTDSRRIARANVHLMPDASIPTNETGTRHRTAERVARSLGVPVVSVSEEMAVIAIYIGDVRHQLQDVSRLLDRANQALQTLERYKVRLDDALANLTALEIEDLVTLRDVAAVLQRAEMVHRIAAEIETMIAELGVDARLLRLQLDEIYGEIDTEIELAMRDYRLTGDAPLGQAAGLSAMETLEHLTRGEPLDMRLSAMVLGLPDSVDADTSLTPRGERLLARVPRLPAHIAERVANHFGDLSRVLRATVADLAEVEGVGTTRAKSIKDALARITETSILDQYA
jgi:diadenylate cyclase